MQNDQVRYGNTSGEQLVSEGQSRHCILQEFVARVSAMDESSVKHKNRYLHFLHRALQYTAAQCIVIGPVCGFVCVCVFVGLFCYHDNSKLRASILTKLGL